jgi:hypothetical protein
MKLMDALVIVFYCVPMAGICYGTVLYLRRKQKQIVQ